VAKPKQERAIKTRETVIYAAASVFEESGFSTASIQEILVRAGVTKGALYFHFPSKEDLAQAVMVAQADTLQLPSEPEGLQTLIDMTAYLARELQTNALLRAGVRLSVEQVSFGLRYTQPYQLWVDAFTRQLAAAKEQGELLSHTDPSDLAELIVSSFSGIQIFSEIYAQRTDLPERIVVMWRNLLPGIAVPGVLPHLQVEGSAHSRERVAQ
jgi:AcrR family transcriptional regulator